MKNIVYTCITNNYDSLKDPSIISDGWEYVCYTNSDLKSDIWQIQKIYDSSLDAKKLARFIKLHPHELFDNYDIVLWVDSNLKINVDLNEFMKNNFNTNSLMAMMTHGRRNCIYEEAKQCSLELKDDPKVIENQMDLYRKEGFPPNYGMSQTGVMFRRNNTEVKTFCEKWWNEIYHGSCRDQLSFFYTMWKYPVPYNLFTHEILFSEFRSHEHGT